jgi:uncharacterized protein (DUF885 family)
LAEGASAMLNRRAFLCAAASAAVAPVPGARAQSAAAPSDRAGAELARLIDDIMDEWLRRSPEQATSLGLDKGPRAGAKWRLDDRSLAAVKEDRRNVAANLARLKTIDRKALGGQSAVNYDIVAYWLDSDDQANRWFDYASGRPYVLSQMYGAYTDVPDFLDSKHTIETRADADAYLARLENFATALDQETERLHYDGGREIVLPDFALAKTLKQLNEMAQTPAPKSPLVRSLVGRTKEKGLTGDYEGAATQIYRGLVAPALDRQIGALLPLSRRATGDAGIWKLKDGDAGYAAMLKVMTTTSMSADEIHQVGREKTAEIGGRLDGLLRAQGLTQGTVGARLATIFNDEKYRYPNNDAGKKQLFDDLNQRLDEVYKRLGKWFDKLPAAKVKLSAVPAAKELGAPAAYYEAQSLDGTVPGTCYFNLSNTARWPKWRPASILFHEASPGHHLQNALTRENSDLALLNKTLWFAAYGEGWALYAEQLADEMGMYEGDPLSEIGYWHAALLRAVRLVTDTGLHSKRWTREQATDYMIDVMGNQKDDAESEVDRYCVTPGQACSYMIGKTKWLDLRERMRRELGPRYDIRAFHRVGLNSGPMPLEVLEGVVQDFIRANKG